MDQVRKITVQVPEDLLESAQSYTGEGVTSTVVQGLKKLASAQAQQELRKLRGKVKFSLSVGELRFDNE